MRDAPLKIFSGNSNLPLAKEICTYLGTSLGAADIRRFSDGEIAVEITENVRGGDVFVMQSICTPGNDNLMELLLMLDAFKRASANRITAVIPYYGYARQDRKVAPRVPISAKLVADLVTAAGASRVLTAELHAGQIQGFFNIPVDNLFSAPVLPPRCWRLMCRHCAVSAATMRRNGSCPINSIGSGTATSPHFTATSNANPLPGSCAESNNGRPNTILIPACDSPAHDLPFVRSYGARPALNLNC